MWVKRKHQLFTDLLLLEQRGIKAFDAHLQKQVRVFAPVLIFIGDNPRASEILNHGLDCKEVL